MRDHSVLCAIDAPRFGALIRLYPLNPTLISNKPVSTVQAFFARAANLAN